MAIDQAIAIISNIDKAYRAFTPEEIQALEASLNAMRKHQEIEEILNADLEHIHPLDRDPFRLAKIREVLENVD